MMYFGLGFTGGIKMTKRLFKAYIKNSHQLPDEGLKHILFSLKEKLNEFMENEKPYLNPDITLKKIAKELAIHPNYLSYIINDRMDQGFWDYINNFTEFNGYYYQVLTTYKDRVFQMPINLETINSFYNINLKPYEVDTFLKNEVAREQITNPCNFEEKAISLIGRPLYEAFIKGYTKKQWGKEPRDLPESILKRLPFRKNYNENYYFDRWQGVPLFEYTKIFNRLLENKNIDIKLNTDYYELRNNIPESTVIIYSGPIDQFFNYKYGKLEWRTIVLKKQIVPVEDYQGTSVMNYAEESVSYTRIHEPRHLHPEIQYTKEKTLLIEEYSKLDDGSAPYYPIADEKNETLFLKYSGESKKLKNVIISGRLGDYKYYDMDKTIAMALESYERRVKKML